MLEKMKTWVLQNKYIAIAALLVSLKLIFGFFFRNRLLETFKSKYTENSGDGGDFGGDSTNIAELYLFSVDWCPHCKTAKPEWDKISSQYADKKINNYKVIFSDVNCTQETPEVTQLINKYDIQGYPTIKLVKNGQVIDYDAKVTGDNLLQFLTTTLV
jgi:thiol-disulfide isomerase/thioredoxin